MHRQHPSLSRHSDVWQVCAASWRYRSRNSGGILSDYWSKKLRTPSSTATPTVNAAVAAAPVPDQRPAHPPAGPPPSDVFVAQDRAPTGAGYVALSCLLLVAAGLVDHQGSRTPFMLSALALAVLGAGLVWIGDTTAIRRLEFDDDDDHILLVNARRRVNLAVAERRQIDTLSSNLAQFFGWSELVFRTATSAVHVRRLDDPADLVWRIKQRNTAVDARIHHERRPWIVNVAVTTLAVTGILLAGGALSNSDHWSHAHVTFALVQDGAVFLCSLMLLVSSQAAWRFLVVFLSVAFGVALIRESFPAYQLGANASWLILLFTPGVRSWASD